MVRATVRMKKGAEEWKKSRKIQDALILKVEAMKKAEASRNAASKKTERAEAIKNTPRIESMRTPARMESSFRTSARGETTKRKSRKMSSGHQ